MSDFKALVEEMKKFYGVSSLEAVAEKMGYSKSSATLWRNNKKLTAHAQLKWFEAKNIGKNTGENFDELVREMQAFYGVSNLEDVAEKMGYNRKNAFNWRKKRKLSAHAQLRWLEAKNNRESTHKNTIEEENTMSAEELKSAKQTLGVKTNRELAELLGVSTRAVEKYSERGLPKKLRTLVEQKGVTTTTERTLFVPLLSLKASAGYGIENFEQRQEGGIYLDIKLFKVMPNVKCLCGMQVSGDSMSPTLRNGDYVVIDTSQKGGRDGIYVLLVGNELLIKRLQFRLDGGIEILSDNPHYKSMHYDANETQQYLEIVGRVVYEGHEL